MSKLGDYDGAGCLEPVGSETGHGSDPWGSGGNGGGYGKDLGTGSGNGWSDETAWKTHSGSGHSQLGLASGDGWSSKPEVLGGRRFLEQVGYLRLQLEDE